MSVELTPLSGGSVEGAYLDVAAARSLAATLPGDDFTALLAKSDDELGVMLLIASFDIDAAMPYQGVRYDAGGDQAREFPRYQRVVTGTQSAGVWDWDDDNGVAIVPKRVTIACLYQAASLLDPSARRRLEAIRSGLASQSVGSISETYLNPKDVPGGLTGLCDRAQRLMGRYRLRTAQML